MSTVSIPVIPSAIEPHIAARPFAYVMTSADSGIHVVAVRVEVCGQDIDCSRVGKSTRRNIAADPRVTIVCPPAHDDGDEHFDYSLVIDGVARVIGEQVVVEVRSAVLHRPA